VFHQVGHWRRRANAERGASSPPEVVVDVEKVRFRWSATRRQEGQPSRSKTSLQNISLNYQHATAKAKFTWKIGR